IAILGWSILLLLVQTVLPSAAARDLPLTYLAGPRDENRRSASPISGRLSRALHNLMETYPAFVALALALAVTGKTGGMATTGAWLWLIARIIYVPLYAAGIPMLRSLVWLASIVGLLLMLV